MSPRRSRAAKTGLALTWQPRAGSRGSETIFKGERMRRPAARSHKYVALIAAATALALPVPRRRRALCRHVGARHRQLQDAAGQPGRAPRHRQGPLRPARGSLHLQIGRRQGERLQDRRRLHGRGQCAELRLHADGLGRHAHLHGRSRRARLPALQVGPPGLDPRQLPQMHGAAVTRGLPRSACMRGSRPEKRGPHARQDGR